MGSLFLTGKWSNSMKTKAHIQHWGLYRIPYYQIVPSIACQKNHYLITKYQLKSTIRHSCSSHNNNRNNINSRQEKKKKIFTRMMMITITYSIHPKIIHVRTQGCGAYWSMQWFEDHEVSGSNSNRDENTSYLFLSVLDLADRVT